MATVQEMMMDAAASIDTAEMMSAGDTFNGTLDNKNDEDWIRIELTAGMLYTISLSGAEMDGSADTILKLFDSKGGPIDSNDDIDGAMGNLNSELEFTPEVSGVYYISASAYTGNPSQDNKGAYTVTVTEMDAPDPTGGEAIEGTEMADKLFGTGLGEEISGLGGNDSLYAMAGDDTLVGGPGDDLLVGGPGADILKGGTNNSAENKGDTISYAASMAGVIINLTTGTARGGDADGDTIVHMGDDKIENVIGSGYDDVLTGSSVANSLWGLGGNDELDGGRNSDMLFGGSGDDNLDGGRGDDTLEGGPGADVLTGGDGMDTASYAGSTMGVMVRLHNSKADGGDAKGDTFGGTVTAKYMNEDGDEFEEMLPDIANLTGSANADILAGDFRNNTIMGGGGDDKIFGGPGGGVNSTNADMLHGGDGNDMIWGGAGDDMLNGDAGDDMLVGGAGADTYDGGAGDDMIIADADDTTINGGEGTDTVSYAALEDSPGARTLGGTAGTPGVTISNVENIIGSQDDDTLNGEDNMANVIEGGEGGDDMDGGVGAGDTLSYASSDDWVRVTLGATAAEEADTSRGHASGDSATNFENITGSAHDDDLTGNVEANVIKGGGGDDELTGGGGADTIEGGAGADELDGGVARAANQTDDEGDTLSYASSDAGVTVNLATAKASGGHAAGDIIATVETDHDGDTGEDEPTDEIEVSTFENITGSMHKDILAGDYRPNVLKGGGGDDNLRAAVTLIAL